jgi:hypothetical protein
MIVPDLIQGCLNDADSFRSREGRDNLRRKSLRNISKYFSALKLFPI